MAARPIRADGFVDPCIPRAVKPPVGPDWVHEIKHDGYRLIVRRDGKVVQLFTRRGYDWTDRARDQRGRLMRQEPAGKWSAARR
jgi:ATP-dependent DNA ligase